MRLMAHPDTPFDAVTGFEADASRGDDGGLRLGWRLAADPGGLRLPASAAVARVDGLWRHTCFEAFISGDGAPAYIELNFSPSGEWAAYRFEDYRQGMAPLVLPGAPSARWQRLPGGLELAVSLPPLAATGGELRLALCAVVEARSGTISYWAPGHPPGAPDFHHATNRALAVAAPGRRAP
jgi:hypothetical protein